jgi:hypothetical protein
MNSVRPSCGPIRHASASYGLRTGGSPITRNMKRGKKMATKKMTPKKSNKSKVLHKSKKIEATKPLAVNAYLTIDGVKSE